MFKDSGISFEDEVDTFGNANVGDDEGNKEYPFVTSPTVLDVMRKLHDLNKKEIAHDFVNCSPEYDICPKGSFMTKYCKPSIPGAFYSCPILHESGYDFFSLPTPQRRSPRTKMNSGVLSRRQKNRRSTCRKCSQVNFIHVDPCTYHETYLNQCTYSKLKPCIGSNGCSFSKTSKHDTSYNSWSDQVLADKEDGDGQSDNCCGNSSWADLKLLVNPFKSNKQGGEKKPKKRLKSAAVKPVINSRYRTATRRRSRHNVNAMHVRLSDFKNDDSTAADSTGDGPKNPFPMPDVFEEIYFGQMPESLNSLPLPLQNFKKIQMKMAGDSNASSGALLESHKNKGHTNPLIVTNSRVASVASATLNRSKNKDQSQLPLIKATVGISVSPSNDHGTDRLQYTEKLSKQIEKTAKDAINNLNNRNRQKLISRRSSFSFRTSRTNHSAGKKKSLILPKIRKSQRLRPSTKISSNHSLTRKIKSNATILHTPNSRVYFKRRTLNHNIHPRFLLDSNSQKICNSEHNNEIITTPNAPLHEEINGSFHDDNGKFSTHNYRQSLLRFIEENKKDYTANSETNANPEKPESGFKKVGSKKAVSANNSLLKRPVTAIKRKKLKSKLKGTPRNAIISKPVTITIYKRANASRNSTYNNDQDFISNFHQDERRSSNTNSKIKLFRKQHSPNSETARFLQYVTGIQSARNTNMKLTVSNSKSST